MKICLAANWKMNKAPAEAESFCQEALKQEVNTSTEVIIFPSTLSCDRVAQRLKNSDISWGGQNSYFEPQGAFTGETSPAVLKEMGASSVLVGHSERREIFKESDELLAKKVKAAHEYGLTPLFCVGETLEERKAGRSLEIVKQQLEKGLNDADTTKPLTVAYEPVWAIGTGEVATPEMVQEVHQEIRKILAEKAPETWGTSSPILYGGSVKPANAAELASLPDVNGFLVGGASLEVPSFFQIYQSLVSAKGL